MTFRAFVTFSYLPKFKAVSLVTSPHLARRREGDSKRSPFYIEWHTVRSPITSSWNLLLPTCLDMRLGNGCSLKFPRVPQCSCWKRLWFQPRFSSKMCRWVGCVSFLLYSSQQPWEINYDIITSWHHLPFTAGGHWAIYSQRTRTTATKPPLSARSVAVSDSHKRKRRAGGCWCWTLEWMTMPLVTGLPGSPGTSSVIVDFGPCSFCCSSSSEKSKFHSGSLGVPFHFFFSFSF